MGTMRNIAVLLTLLATLTVLGQSTLASHTENPNFEPFDAKSLNSMPNGGPSCGGVQQGNYIRAIQRMLRADEFYLLVVDGIWGQATETGMRNWQTYHNQSSDGCFGRHSADHAQEHITDDAGSCCTLESFEYRARSNVAVYWIGPVPGAVGSRFYEMVAHNGNRIIVVDCRTNYTNCITW